MDPSQMGLKPQQESAPAQSNCLLIENMFDLKTVNLDEDPYFFIDVKDQIKTACKDFGRVDQVHIQ